MLFEKEMFNPECVEDKRTIAVLGAAVERASPKVRPSDLLAAAIETGDAKVLAMLEQALVQGSTPGNVLEIINIFNEPGLTHGNEFYGSRDCFSTEALDALDQFSNDLTSCAQCSHEVILYLLLSCVLSHMDEEEMKNLLKILDAKKGAEIFRKMFEISNMPLTPLFDSTSNRLRSDEFSESAWSIIESAGVRASDLGYDLIMPPHCFLALLSETEGVTERLVRLQAPPDYNPGKVANMVEERFQKGDSKQDTIKLTRDCFDDTMVELLRTAQKTARIWREEQIDTYHLLSALLDVIPPRLAYVLKQDPLNIDITKMHQQLNQQLREARRQDKKKENAYLLPEGLLPSEDLTYLARIGFQHEMLHFNSYFETITRALYRRKNNNVLVTGLRGVGKTALVRELARRAANGEIPYLKRKRFLWVDCMEVTPKESMNKFEGILSYTTSRTDLILCLDGLGSLLRAESGSNNKILLRSVLKENRINLIGVMSNQDYDDLLISDHETLEFFTRVNVEEPKEEAAIDIVKNACVKLEQEYKVAIEERAIERTIILSTDYILNECLPTKAIKILQQVCEDIDYEKTQHKGTQTNITTADIIKVIANKSGVPEGTLLGVGDEKADYERDFSQEVIGQESAVTAVATQLQLIKAGLTDPGKPASVMFFSGLTGVGKTELAKTLAKFYSSSKRLQTYTMGNFTDSHTISGIIGVPPGYVGHEQGGRLINDLNSDPYCVFLLDEAEKAHPDIWKPFLHLFDEGWIVDQRSVKAFADRAIFILTSNSGHEIISRMSQANAPMDEIIHEVKRALSKVRNDRTNQPIFPPEFLARINQIIIFKPLDENAMKGICEKFAARMITNWKEKREKKIIIPENLIEYIAKQSHIEDKKSGYEEGGRIVRKMLRELVEAPIQHEATRKEYQYKTCDIIELLFIAPGQDQISYQSSFTPKVTVRFDTEKTLSPSECLTMVISKLKQDLLSKKDAGSSMHELISDSYTQIDEAMKRWAMEHAGEADDVTDEILKQFRKTCSDFEQEASNSKRKSQAIIEELIKALEHNTL